MKGDGGGRKNKQRREIILEERMVRGVGDKTGICSVGGPVEKKCAGEYSVDVVSVMAGRE